LTICRIDSDHKEKSNWFKEPLGNTVGANDSTFFENCTRAQGGLNLDIDGWLRGIGLAQYAEIFRANDIDDELLGRLTNDDLKDIGVASLGHRKKLLEAIAALTAAPEAPSSIPVAVTEPKTHDTAQRRQVTVMFSDLVGSTALSAHLGLSEMRR